MLANLLKAEPLGDLAGEMDAYRLDNSPGATQHPIRGEKELGGETAMW